MCLYLCQNSLIGCCFENDYHIRSQWLSHLLSLSILNNAGALSLCLLCVCREAGDGMTFSAQWYCVWSQRLFYKCWGSRWGPGEISVDSTQAQAMTRACIWLGGRRERWRQEERRRDGGWRYLNLIIISVMDFGCDSLETKELFRLIESY